MTRHLAWEARTVEVGGMPLPVPEFLRQAVMRAEHPGSVTDGELCRLIDVFLETGLAAVHAASGVSWVQYGIRPEEDRRRLYGELADALQELRAAGLTDEFFFVHKPPGLRIRCRALPGRRADLDEQLLLRLGAWQRAGLIGDWRPGVYEPESHLFGGPASMRSVHKIFTADTLAWLSFHAAGRPVGPAWAMSLLMVRALFDGLGVVDWEDIDVWNRVRWQAGRALSGDVHTAGTPVGAALRRAWADPDRMWSLLDASVRDLVEVYRRAVVEECRRWQADYFIAPSAYVGPREAATFVIVFHWNRAGLSAVRQAVVAEALSVRGGQEPSV